MKDVLRSEFCKLRTVRSTLWTLLAACIANVAVAVVLSVVLPGRISANDLRTADPVQVSLGGIHLSQIAFAVLGVLTISSEYGTGMIRTSLTAVPDRRRLLAAKTVIYACVAMVIGVASTGAAFTVFQSLLTGDALRAEITDPGVLRAVIGGGLFLAVLGLLGLGLGAALRSSAAAITGVLGLLFVPPVLVNLLPHSWNTTLNPYIPMEAGGQIYLAHPGAGGLGAWPGFAVLSLYAAVALAAGFTVISRRDA